MEEQTQNDERKSLDPENYKPPIRPKSWLESFRYALDGILDVIRTQRHMQFHMITVVIVLIVGYVWQLDNPSLLILLFTISLVLISEMFNTAIEAVVDMVTQTYHPLAKFAKDAAAGAVLIATSTAVLVGFLLFAGSQSGEGMGGPRPEDPNFVMKASIAAVVLLALVAIIKALGKQGKLMRGGIISGHAAAGFFCAFTIIYLEKNAVTAVIAIIMALLLVQSRVQAKIHSVQEVIAGALVAMLLTVLLYWFWPACWLWSAHLLERVSFR
jgi:diacylglycerol kinase (ATP)